MNASVTIRAGRVADAADMARIFNHYVKESTVIFSNTTLSEQDMHDKMLRLNVGEKFPFFVAESGGRVTGYAYAHLWQPDPVYGRTWEVTIYLDHSCMGKGIGTALLSRLVAECRERGAHILISCITEGNEPCERLHSRLGFTRVGCIPGAGYKFGRFLNDVFYHLAL